MSRNSALVEWRVNTAEGSSGLETGRPRTGGAQGISARMHTIMAGPHKKVGNCRAEGRMPLRMGKIKLQTEPCEGKSEERPCPFVSLGRASKAGMIPVGCTGATARAGEGRSDSDVMTDAATAPTYDQRAPEEVELSERARRCEEANLLDVWGSAPPARNFKTPRPLTATSLLPEKASPSQRKEACAAQQPSHGAEKLTSWSCPGPGRGNSDACQDGRLLRQRIGSSSARARGKSAVNMQECASIACEECSTLRREVDFLKHIITTRSLPFESSPGTTGAGTDVDMGLPSTGHSPSSSSRMSPLETRVHMIPSNTSQQTHFPSPTFVPRPPPSGHLSSSPEGPCSSKARPSTSLSSRNHSARARTGSVAPIFLENLKGQGRRTESSSIIARQRRVSNPTSADDLADQQVHFSRTGSLDGGISSAPRPCAPKRTGTNFHAEFARPPVQPSPPSTSDPFAMRKLDFLRDPSSSRIDKHQGHQGPALSMRGTWRTEADFVSQPMQAYADYRHDLAQMQAEMERLEAEMAEMMRRHAAEVQSLKEESVRRGTEASLASDRREVQLRSQIMDAAQKARKHIFEHQMAESKISGGASPSITLAGHDKTLAEESKEAHDALEREREAAQLSSLTLWMMTTGRKAASFISATGEAASVPHALLVTLQHDPDFRDLVFQSCGQELCAHLTLACVA